MRMPITRTLIRVWLPLAWLALSLACGRSTSVGNGGNTNWLSACDEDADCDEQGVCFEERCTVRCQDEATCTTLSTVATCAARAPTSSSDASCDVGASLDQACIPRCDSDQDCEAMPNAGTRFACFDGLCQTRECQPFVLVASPGSAGCEGEGTSYADGDTYSAECNTCTCTDGAISCTTAACVDGSGGNGSGGNGSGGNGGSGSGRDGPGPALSCEEYANLGVDPNANPAFSNGVPVTITNRRSGPIVLGNADSCETEYIAVTSMNASTPGSWHGNHQCRFCPQILAGLLCTTDCPSAPQIVLGPLESAFVTWPGIVVTAVEVNPECCTSEICDSVCSMPRAAAPGEYSATVGFVDVSEEEATACRASVVNCPINGVNGFRPTLVDIPFTFGSDPVALEITEEPEPIPAP